MSRTRSSDLRLGTRGSPLALWQADWVRSSLEAAVPGLRVERIPIRTTGDRILDRPLARIGGKGLFTRELDSALLESRITLAVHSLKDLPFTLPDGIVIGAVMPRADPRDAWVSNRGRLSEMPHRARVGTGSLRRRAQLLHRDSGLDIHDLRGNVDTRLGKLDRGDYDGIVLAAAGLDRLGRSDRITERLPTDVLLPAAGQGAVVAVCRSGDRSALEILKMLDDRPTRTAVAAERALLEVLEGSCQIPVGAHATLAEHGRLTLEGLVASPDGHTLSRSSIAGDAAEPEILGRELGQRLLASGGREILAAIR